MITPELRPYSSSSDRKERNYVDDISPGGDGFEFGAHSPILAMFSQFEQHDAAICGPSKYTSRLSYHSLYVGWEADLLSEEVPSRTATRK